MVELYQDSSCFSKSHSQTEHVGKDVGDSPKIIQSEVVAVRSMPLQPIWMNLERLAFWRPAPCESNLVIIIIIIITKKGS